MAKLRLLVSKSKTWHIKKVSIVANEPFKEAGLILNPGDKVTLQRPVNWDQLGEITRALSSHYWADVLITKRW